MPDTRAPVGDSTSQSWALQLPTSHAAALFPLRLRRDIEVLAADELWLRGRTCAPNLLPSLQALPATQRFEWTQPDALRPIHSRLHSERLPAGEWQPIGRWIEVAFPPPQTLWAQPVRVCLKLKRGGESKTPTAAILSFETFATWIESAPLIRMRPLSFALSAGKRCLVLGSPLPPLPQQTFVEEDHVLTPVGFTIDPPVSRAVIRQLYAVPANHYLLIEHEVIHVLPPEVFVPVQRSALRASANAGSP